MSLRKVKNTAIFILVTWPLFKLLHEIILKVECMSIKSPRWQ